MEKYNERENYLLDLNKILGPKLRKKLPRFVINFLKRRIHEDDVNHVVMTVEHYKGVEFFDEDTTQGTSPSIYEMDLNAYATKADFERLVPKRERRYLHVGEDVMRQIVVDEGERFAAYVHERA